MTTATATNGQTTPAQPEPHAAAAGPRPQYKRRQYVVDKAFQYKYTSLIAVIGAGIAGTMGWLLYDSIRETTEVVEMLTGFPELQDTLKDNDEQRLITILMGVTALVLALVGWGIIMTHRVAGPIYVFTRYARELASGSYPSTRPLRQKDELKEFHQAFTHMLEELVKRDRKDLTEIQHALKHLDGLKTQAQHGNVDPAHMALEVGKVYETLRAMGTHKAKRLKMPAL